MYFSISIGKANAAVKPGDSMPKKFIKPLISMTLNNKILHERASFTQFWSNSTIILMQ